MSYNGGLTREQFLVNEARIVARFMLEDKSDEMIIESIYKDNLFQYPTERMIRNIAGICIKRLRILDNMNLLYQLANGTYELAKQINFYAIIKKERLIREFMIDVIAKKYEVHDYSFSKNDVYLYLLKLQEQDDRVASWSDATINKLRQVITKMMIEVGYLDSPNSSSLNEILLDYELERGIIDNGDSMYLPIFNRFV